MPSFRPGELWLDTNGVHINAHGGGVLFHDGSYYWFGEHKVEGSGGNAAWVGVHCYSSTNLYEWHDEGIALAVSADPESDITKGCVIERPKVVHNESTGTFVMWFHLELKDKGYSAARSGVAVSSKVTGPYVFLESFRPNAGVWPVNIREEQKLQTPGLTGISFGGGEDEAVKAANILARDFTDGQMARDMTLFVDDDGAVYHAYASEENGTLQISRLSADCLRPAGRFARAFEHRWMEAPAIFRRKGCCYFIGSGCTGWAPNGARSARADSVFGPWRELGNPCVGTNPANGLGAELTFGGQSTCVLKVQGLDDAYVAMFDLWRPKDAIDGRYLWLPIRFRDDRFEVVWLDEWDLSYFVKA